MNRDDGISALVPDWSREQKRFWEWNPGRSLLASIRTYQRYARARNPLHVLIRAVAVLRHRMWSVISGADIPLNSSIAGGLMIPHPNGIVIHPDAEIGPNCLILQQVTIGTGAGGIPKVHGHVDIGAGAKILGGIIVHDHAVVGANAVVLQDVPVASTAVGVPCRIIPPGNLRQTG